MTDYFVGEGDRLPSLSATLEDENGPLDLTNYTVVVYGRKYGSTETFSGSAVLANQTTSPGGVSYAWAAGNTVTPGRWFIQWKATTGGKTVTFPNTGTDELFVNNFWASTQ